ncbi:MAG: hypothetical protein ACTS27_10860 [Phycisphaerales bacterium]
MRSPVSPFRSASCLLAFAATSVAHAAQEVAPELLLDADAIRAMAPHVETERELDPFGRTNGGFTLDMINPALRLEYGAASRGMVDMTTAFDNLNATQRAEMGLANRDPGQVYDASLRFDAARIHEVSLFLRGGVRSGFAEEPAGANATVFDSLEWTPVAGGGVEWRPGSRGLFLAGSTLINLDESSNAVAEFTAELGMRVTPDLSVSLGYRTLDSNFRAPSDAAEDLKDAAFAAIRLRF